MGMAIMKRNGIAGSWLSSSSLEEKDGAVECERCSMSPNKNPGAGRSDHYRASRRPLHDAVHRRSTPQSAHVTFGRTGENHSFRQNRDPRSIDLERTRDRPHRLSSPIKGGLAVDCQSRTLQNEGRSFSVIPLRKLRPSRKSRSYPVEQESQQGIEFSFRVTVDWKGLDWRIVGFAVAIASLVFSALSVLQSFGVI